MPVKKKFKPLITKIELNPEQAVLTCTCFDSRYRGGGGSHYSGADAVTGYSVCWGARQSDPQWYCVRDYAGGYVSRQRMPVSSASIS